MYVVMTGIVHIKGDEVKYNEYVNEFDNLEKAKENYKLINNVISEWNLMGSVRLFDDDTGEVLSP